MLSLWKDFDRIGEPDRPIKVGITAYEGLRSSRRGREDDVFPLFFSRRPEIPDTRRAEADQ